MDYEQALEQLNEHISELRLALTTMNTKVICEASQRVDHWMEEHAALLESLRDQPKRLSPILSSVRSTRQLAQANLRQIRRRLVSENAPSLRFGAKTLLLSSN